MVAERLTRILACFETLMLGITCMLHSWTWTWTWISFTLTSPNQGICNVGPQSHCKFSFERVLKSSFAIDKLWPFTPGGGAGAQGPSRIPVKPTPPKPKLEEGDEGDEWCFQEKAARNRRHGDRDIGIPTSLVGTNLASWCHTLVRTSDGTE